MHDMGAGSITDCVGQLTWVLFAGRGLELFSAVLEPQADSAWLKCLILKFCLFAQSSLHEAGPSQSESVSSVSDTFCSGQQPDSSTEAGRAEQPNPSMPSANQKPLSKKQRQKQNSRAAALAKKPADSSKSAVTLQAHSQDLAASAQFNGQHPDRQDMAVPAASETHAGAANGFSAHGALDTPSSEGTASSILHT